MGVKMSQYFSNMLLGNLPSGHVAGKRIRFANDESDDSFTVGPVLERVLGYLRRIKSPATTRDIGAAVGIRPSHLSKTLQKLYQRDLIDIRKQGLGVWVYLAK